MALAFVLASAEVGSEEEILKGLRKITEVKEAYPVYGVYDIVAKVEAGTMEELRGVIASKVRKVKGIRSTLTMIVMEGAEAPAPKDQ